MPGGENRADEHWRNGHGLGILGFHRQAAEEFDRAIEIEEATDTPRERFLIGLYTRAGDAYQSAGAYEQAEARLDWALLMDQRCLEPTHPEILARYRQLAELLGRMGRQSEAQAITDLIHSSRSDGQEPPRLVTQRGHSQFVTSYAFSQDGRQIASASADFTVRVWDIRAGLEVRILRHDNIVRAAAFSPDGNTLVSASSDGTVRFWDVHSGRERWRLSIPDQSIQAMAVDWPRHTLALGVHSNHEKQSTVRIYDLATRQQLWHSVNVSGEIESLAISPDGKTLAFPSGRETIRLWDIPSRMERWPRIGAPEDIVRQDSINSGEKHKHTIGALTFSPNGSQLISSPGWRHESFVHVWDLKTGEEQMAFYGGGDRPAFSPTGSLRATSDSGATPVVHIWDFDAGKQVQLKQSPSSRVPSLALSPDGRTLVSGSSMGMLAIWDLTEGRISHTLLGDLTTDIIAFAPDGATLAANVSTEPFAVDDPDGRILGRNVVSRPFAANDIDLEYGIRLWDVASWQPISPLIQYSDNVTSQGYRRISSITFTSDGNGLITGNTNGIVQFWDLQWGEEIDALYTVPSAETGRLSTRPNIINVAIAPDDMTLAINGSQGISLWDMQTGSELPIRDVDAGGAQFVTFSPKSRLLAASTIMFGFRLIFWDLDTNQSHYSTSFHDMPIDTGVFSPDGTRFASGSDDWTIKLWDVASGELLHTLIGHEDAVNTLAFLPDGRFMVSGSDDKTIKLWDTTTGQLLATLVAYSDGHWVVTDPQGRFDASSGGDNPHLHWVFANTPITLAQLKDRYYDPGLLAKILGFNPEPLRTVPSFKDSVLHLWPRVALELDPANPHRVHIQLTDQGDGYGRVRVRLNGKEVSTAANMPQDLDGSSATVTLDLDPDRLLPGDNRVDVVAWPATGHIPSPEAVITLPGAGAERGRSVKFGNAVVAPPENVSEPITLHAIVIGVGQYASPDLRLAFAGKDAADFANAVELGGARLFGADRVSMHLLTDYSAASEIVSDEQQPTRANLRRAFATVAEEAAANDILVVYLAGHGVTGPGRAGEADYYYLTREAQGTDLSDAAVRKLWGVSSQELTDWIKPIFATKQAMILDTCAAGGAIERLIAERRIPGAQIIALEQLKDRTGFHILAGATADRVSYEATRYGQGLLTYALLTGMKGAALKNGDIVDVQALFQYARNQVPLLARQVGGIQQPRLASPRGDSFAVGRMAEADRQLIPVASAKPMVLRSNFQDETRWQDYLKIGQHFDDRLRLETYAAEGGALVFVDADDFPEAWLINGRYTREAKGVRVQARLFRDNRQQGGFELMLPLDPEQQADALLSAMMAAIEGSAGE